MISFILLLIYLAFLIRIVIMHFLHDLDFKKREAIFSDPEREKRVRRLLYISSVFIALLWPLVFTCKPLLFLKAYLLNNSDASSAMHFWYGKVTMQILGPSNK